MRLGSMDANIQAAAARLSRRLKKGNHTLTLAESCTGGLLASTLTDISGSSAWFQRAFITYANEAKIEELGVDPEDLASRGAVSAQVAIQMAKGALKRANADYAISVTGIAGPTNEGSSKPVGTVYVGIASRTWANAKRTQIGGTRAENKAGFVHFALLTAMDCWDEAMVRMEEQIAKEISDIEAALRQKAEREQELARRNEAAREKAPWQDEAWEGEPKKKKLDLEVEWTDGEE
jgi:nicotinamide-nucleotide amidase